MAVAGTAVMALNQFSPKFRTSFGISGKAAFVVMATGFATWSQGEREMDRTKKEMKSRDWNNSVASFSPQYTSAVDKAMCRQEPNN